MKEYFFYADAHVNRKKHRAAVVLEEIISAMPTDESNQAARFANTALQHANTYIKDLKHLNNKRNAISKLVLHYLIENLDKKDKYQKIRPIVKSLVKNLIHARFRAEVFDK